MMAESTLPQKRNGDETVVSPKTKAQKKEEAILKAREWARKRKGVVGDDVETGISPKKAARAEAEDVITNLPDIPAKKPSRRSGADDISDTESIGSRTRSRRRSMGAAKVAAPAPEPVAPPKKRRGRPRRTPAKKDPPVVEEQVVEEKVAEPTPVKEDEKVAAEPVEEVKAPETETKEEEPAVVQEEAVQEEAIEEETKISFLPHFAVFLHSVIIQWSVAFAVIMTFCLDWWLFQFGPSSKEILSSQRSSATMLGMWLVTIAGYSIAFGTFSQVGWILTTSSLAMLSFAVKMVDEDTSSASLPVYKLFGFGVNIPDILLCISFVACIFITMHPPVPAEEVVPSEPAPVPSEEPVSTPSEEVVDAEESKEVMEAVMIAAKEATGPKSLIGQRVCVEDSGFPSFGTVAGYDEETRFWKVLYDDVNQEEGSLNRVELASAFKSYSKHLADSLKAMWKSGEI